MRLVTLRHGGRTRLGVVHSDGSHIVELSEPGDMLALIDAGERGLDKGREAAAKGGGHEHAIDDVQPLPPLPQPPGKGIVTADEVPDPQALSLQLRVNGVTKQDGHTSDMIYAVEAIIEWVSKGMTLMPGSIIATGTPDGVGFARTPPEFLRPGDVMETEVVGVGLLRNRIVAAGMD